MEIRETRQISSEDEERLFKIWNQVYPAQITWPNLDAFQKYLENLPNKKHFLFLEKEKIMGWLATFDRDGGRWFVLIVDSNCHGQGIGSKLLDAMKEHEISVFGWMIRHQDFLRQDGQTYRPPEGFYLKNGFQVLPETLTTDIMTTHKIQWPASSSSQST